MNTITMKNKSIIMRDIFNNTFRYLKFLIKRERNYLIIYILVISFLILSQAVSFSDLYSSVAKREAGAISMNNPAMVAMLGPVYRDKGSYTLGALLSNQTILYTAILSAIVNIILTIRNTKSDEESGRLELLKSRPIGRLSNYFSLIIMISLVNLLMFLLLGGGLSLLNIKGINLSGSLLFGAITSIFGFFFGSLSLLFSNLFESSRSVYSITFLTLGLFYIVRAIGDINKSKLSLLSPLGWVLKSRAYTGNNWNYSMLLLLLSFFIIIIALYLYYTRDLGDYLLKIGNFKTKNSLLLNTPTGLVFKLLKSSFIVWLLFIFVIGLSYGYLLSDVGDFMDSISYLISNPNNKDYIRQFIAAIFPLLSCICIIPVVLTVRLSIVEEFSGRLETLLSKKVSKIFPLGNVLIISIIQSILILLVFSFGFWISGNSVLNENLSYNMIFRASFMYLPIFWLFISITAFFVAYFPRKSDLVWGYYALSIFLMLFGSTLDLPDLIIKISPFNWLTNYPIKSIDYVALYEIAITSMILILISCVGYKLRDKLR